MIHLRRRPLRHCSDHLKWSSDWWRYRRARAFLTISFVLFDTPASLINRRRQVSEVFSRIEIASIFWETVSLIESWSMTHKRDTFRKVIFQFDISERNEVTSSQKWSFLSRLQTVASAYFYHLSLLIEFEEQNHFKI